MSQLYPIFVRIGRSPQEFRAGFADQHGKTVVTPTFEDATNFHDGHASVRLNQLWGTINEEGDFLFPCTRLYPLLFVNGFAVIREKLSEKEERRGYLRSDGTMVVEPKYVLASNFECGMAWVSDGHSHGFINERGEEVIPLVFQDVRDFREGVAPVKVDQKWGYIDPLGSCVIKPQFDAAMSFREGLARVSVDGLWGFIDHSGAFAVEPRLAMVYDFHSGLSVASWKKRGPKGYIDKSGRCVIEPAYQHAKHFTEGLACVTAPDQRFSHFINPDGGRSFQGDFWTAESFYMQRALVETEKTIAYIDTEGRTVWEGPVVDRPVTSFYGQLR
jgi:hypothetical protein